MAIADEVDRFERERRDADARYNAALTALDRAIVDALAEPAAGREAVARVANALIVFLQQITAFVETKDRQLAAEAAGRVDRLRPTIDAVAELRAQMGIAQRALQALARQAVPAAAGAAQPVAAPAPSIARGASAAEIKYVGFEDQFRGADEGVADKLRGYVSIFAGAGDVLDLGCGRGEFLAALRDAGIPARGVDANGEMAAIARDRGLDAVQADALAFLESLPERSLGGAIATQVVEHLEPGYLVRLADAAFSRLRAGAPIVIETINPACWLAFFSSYIRDLTHVRPVHPDTLQFLLRASGFERVEVRYSAPVPEHMKLQPAHVPAEVLEGTDPTARALAAMTHTLNANAALLNNLLFTYLDYAITAYKPANG